MAPWSAQEAHREQEQEGGMRAELTVEAANLMAASPGWVVLTDDRCTMLFALPGHLRGAFWLYDDDPARLAKRMEKAESYLRKEAMNPPAGRTTRPGALTRRRIPRREPGKPARPAATPKHAIER
jgi:hypothetical protein